MKLKHKAHQRHIVATLSRDMLRHAFSLAVVVGFHKQRWMTKVSGSALLLWITEMIWQRHYIKNQIWSTTAVLWAHYPTVQLTVPGSGWKSFGFIALYKKTANRGKAPQLWLMTSEWDQGLPAAFSEGVVAFAPGDCASRRHLGLAFNENIATFFH